MSEVPIEPFPDPIVGQIWRHKQHQRLYEIVEVGIGAAGQLRHEHKTGCLHTYKCLTTGKTYARITHCWIREHTDFELISPVCAICMRGIYYQECPTGGWWIHCIHPEDDHDATPYLQGPL